MADGLNQILILPWSAKVRGPTSHFFPDFVVFHQTLKIPGEITVCLFYRLIEYSVYGVYIPQKL